MQSMQSLADENQLCYGQIGQEKLTPSKSCFRFGPRKCAGACCGTESKALVSQAAGFDADGYKILCRLILGGSAEVVLLW